MTKEQKQLKTKLTVIFWINITALIAAGIALLYTRGIDGKSVTELDLVMERFGIIAAIVVIPLSLKFFHSRYKKIVKLKLDLFLRKLCTLFTLRMAALSFAVIINLAGFYFIGALNFIYMAGISILVFTMCYPTGSVIDPTEKGIETEEEKEQI